MIVVKTKMKRMPETCKKCSASKVDADGTCRLCGLTGYECPTERKPNGCMGYTMPEWCPLMDIFFPEEED